MSPNAGSEPTCGLKVSGLLAFGGGFGDDGVLDRADALDLDADPLTRSYQPSGEHTDTPRRSGGDEVAGLQRADTGERRDHVADPDNHLLGGAVLTQLAIDPRADTETRGIHLVGGDDPRPKGAMGVKALARLYPWSVLLLVTYRHVATHRVAGDRCDSRGGGLVAR
jgi:hypothetical protein